MHKMKTITSAICAFAAAVGIATPVHATTADFPMGVRACGKGIVALFLPAVETSYGVLGQALLDFGCISSTHRDASGVVLTGSGGLRVEFINESSRLVRIVSPSGAEVAHAKSVASVRSLLQSAQ